MSVTPEELIKEFRRPFPPNVVLSRIQAAYDDKALVVYYIDARHVSERLNQLCPGQWSSAMSEITLGDQVGILCEISIDLGNCVIKRSDVGTKLATDDMGGLKAMASDALKRAAVHLGIGVSLYAQETNWVPETDNGIVCIKRNKNNKLAYIQEPAVKRLADKYKKWLDSEGIKKFGLPVEVD